MRVQETDAWPARNTRAMAWTESSSYSHKLNAHYKRLQFPLSLLSFFLHSLLSYMEQHVGCTFILLFFPRGLLPWPLKKRGRKDARQESDQVESIRNWSVRYTIQFSAKIGASDARIEAGTSLAMA